MGFSLIHLNGVNIFYCGKISIMNSCKPFDKKIKILIGSASKFAGQDEICRDGQDGKQENEEVIEVLL